MSLGVPLSVVVDGVKTYRPLKRRFVNLNERPEIYDGFAHNPDGIKSTVYAGYKLLSDKGHLWIVNAIRGSRGETLNGLNADALVEVITRIHDEDGRKVNLVLSSSEDVVDHLNIVKDSEREIFLSKLDDADIEYTHFEHLKDALVNVLNNADVNDTILLLGAQGMDPAEKILKNMM